MNELLDRLIAAISPINDFLWHDYALFVVLGVGILFTLWSGFSQYRSLTHGVQVIRGRYDDPKEAGAITHFQALSAALSATVGLGNIAGVALAVAVGGPGAVFWMWVTGLVGMALKLTEVTQAMLHRDLSDPKNPSGGAMWVVSRGFARIGPALRPLGWAIGALFCVTLIISGITGGNMFQAWNVAEISFTYFGWNKYVVGAVLAILVALVIVGGIKRIGNVASKLVPFMCGLYVLAGLFVIFTHLGDLPRVFGLIFGSAFGPSTASGAFLGGTAGYAFLKGMQRALFSNEAGQGSAPIAHCAARTNEPVREGIVAGLEPFIDTLVVCTITALVILLSGEWNRPVSLSFESPPTLVAGTEPGTWTIPNTLLRVEDKVEAGGALQAEQTVFAVVDLPGEEGAATRRAQLTGALVQPNGERWEVQFGTVESASAPRLAEPGVFFAFNGATLTAKAFDRIYPGLGLWLVPFAAWLFALSTIISWSYYCEQGVVFLFGRRVVLPYRLLYSACVLLACFPAIRTDEQMDIISSSGTGVMLWVNIPIMLLFGGEAMRAYKGYLRRLDNGEFPTKSS